MYGLPGGGGIATPAGMRSEISAIAPSSAPPVRESDERSSGRETEACGEAKPSRDDIDDSSSGRETESRIDSLLSSSALG